MPHGGIGSSGGAAVTPTPNNTETPAAAMTDGRRDDGDSALIKPNVDSLLDTHQNPEHEYPL